MSSFNSLRLLACDLGVLVKGKRFDFDLTTINFYHNVCTHAHALERNSHRMLQPLTDDDIEPLCANLGRFKCLTKIELVRVVDGGGDGLLGRFRAWM